MREENGGLERMGGKHGKVGEIGEDRSPWVGLVSRGRAPSMMMI